MNEMTVMQFEAAKWALHANVKGLSHEESLVTPERGGNCLNWIVGHLVTAYNSYLPAVGDEAVWDEDLVAPYARGCEALDQSKARPFEELMADFDEAHGRVVDQLAGLSEEQMAAPAPYSPGNNPDETIASLTHILSFHQAYHVGQTGMLRRVVGREGAIA